MRGHQEGDGSRTPTLGINIRRRTDTEPCATIPTSRREPTGSGTYEDHSVTRAMLRWRTVLERSPATPSAFAGARCRGRPGRPCRPRLAPRRGRGWFRRRRAVKARLRLALTALRGRLASTSGRRELRSDPSVRGAPGREQFVRTANSQSEELSRRRSRP